MTVIAWDGTTLAADKAMWCAEHIDIGTKIWKINNDTILAGTGEFSTVLDMVDWWKRGGVPKDFPKRNTNIDTYARLIVVTAKGCHMVEISPVLIEVENTPVAWGSGRDYALGAMAMGAAAVEAVEIANNLCTTCGGGVDHFSL